MLRLTMQDRECTRARVRVGSRFEGLQSNRVEYAGCNVQTLVTPVQTTVTVLVEGVGGGGRRACKFRIFDNSRSLARSLARSLSLNMHVVIILYFATHVGSPVKVWLSQAEGASPLGADYGQVVWAHQWPRNIF